MNNEKDHLPDQIKESYRKLVAEKGNGGIHPESMHKLLDLLVRRPDAVAVLKQYTEGVEIRIDYKIS